MASLEDTVRLVVQDLIKNEVLFTALDVSNTVKQSQPHARHREIRDVVRGLFTTDIESQGWARTPITVTLEDKSTAEALLYHPLTDSWDLDNKYNDQQRAKTTYKPAQVAQATVQAAQQTVVPVLVSQKATVSSQPMPKVVPAPLATARDQWNSLFATQPSLFPKK